MSTSNYVCDGNSEIDQVDSTDELNYNDLWEPWRNIIISVKTAMANITHLQRIARRKNVQIKTEHFADALENVGLLQYTITI